MTESLGDLEFAIKGNFKALDDAEERLRKIDALLTSFKNANLTIRADGFINTLKSIENAANSAAIAVSRVSAAAINMAAARPREAFMEGLFGGEGGAPPVGKAYYGGDWEPAWNFTPKEKGKGFGGFGLSRFASRMIIISAMEAAAAAQRRDIMLAEGDQMSDVGAQLGQTRQMVEGEATGFGWRSVGSFLSDHVLGDQMFGGKNSLTKMLTGYNTTAEAVGEMVRLEQQDKKQQDRVRASQHLQLSYKQLGLLEDNEGYEGISGKLGDFRRATRMSAINPNDKEAVQLQQVSDARDKQIEAIKLETDALRKVAAKVGQSTVMADKYEKEATSLVQTESANQQRFVNRGAMALRLSRQQQVGAMNLLAQGQTNAGFMMGIDAQRTMAISMGQADAAFLNASLDAQIAEHQYKSGLAKEDLEDDVTARHFHRLGRDADATIVALSRKKDRAILANPQLTQQILNDYNDLTGLLTDDEYRKKKKTLDSMDAAIKSDSLLMDPRTSLSARVPKILSAILGDMLTERDPQIREKMGDTGIAGLRALEAETLNAGFYHGNVRQVSPSRTDFSGTNAKDAQERQNILLEAIKAAIKDVEAAIKNTGPAAS